MAQLKSLDNGADLDILSNVVMDQLRQEIKRKIIKNITIDIEPMLNEVLTQITSVSLERYLNDRSLMSELNLNVTINRKPLFEDIHND